MTKKYDTPCLCNTCLEARDKELQRARKAERVKVLELLKDEDLQAEVEVLLYGIVDTYTDNLEELGKEQAQYAILGMGAKQILEALISKLKEEA